MGVSWGILGASWGPLGSVLVSVFVCAFVCVCVSIWHLGRLCETLHHATMFACFVRACSCWLKLCLCCAHPNRAGCGDPASGSSWERFVFVPIRACCGDPASGSSWICTFAFPNRAGCGDPASGSSWIVSLKCIISQAWLAPMAHCVVSFGAWRSWAAEMLVLIRVSMLLLATMSTTWRERVQLPFSPASTVIDRKRSCLLAFSTWRSLQAS